MRSRIVFPLALMALAAGWMARDGRSQQPDQPQPPDNNKPVLRAKTNDVMLPVSVHDKKGALVTNLQKSDFSLTEDGRPQTITAVSRDDKAPFRVGLLVETHHAMSGALETERKAAEKFVDLMLPAQAPEGKSADADSQAFLIHFDREVELLEDFTDSRDKLHRELDDMSPSRQAQNDTQGPETTGDERGDHQHGNRNGNQLYDAIFLASDEVMGPKDGRKALIIFSDGVDRGSKDRLNEALDAAEKAHAVIYTIYFKGEQERENSDYSRNGGRRGGGGGWPGGGGGGYPGGGGGYPNGGGGRRGGSGPSDTGVDGKKIMQQMADRTGGHAYDAHKKDDLEPIYNLIAEELRGQYVLTYTPDKADTEGGFHKVAVKVNKEEHSVTAAEGYFAPGGEGAH
jgi:VWFA-related protein